jgi:hypothetical protein
MVKQPWWLVGLGILLLAGLPARGADPPPAAGDTDRDVRALAERIDKFIAARWAAADAKPALLADDAEFLRRAYLDLAGRIPSVTETRDFLADTAPDKRLRLVDRLLNGSRYVTHFTAFWRSLLVPETANAQFFRFGVGIDAWLRADLTKNAPYDEMVREVLTTPLGPETLRGANQTPNPAIFYLVKELKPEEIAGATSRLFLGVRLECAQCHNHPFAKWKREQFWSYAAFFAGLQRQGPANGFALPGRELTDRRELTIPGTEKVVQAKFLDGKEPTWKAKASARDTLADWVTAPDNPFFARAAVNRLWGYFFGTGIIDPVEDMVGSERVPSHPELLDELAREFVAHKFDLKFMMRAITASRAYQLSSAHSHESQDDPTLFARMPLRGLTAEQLYDSVAQATGYQEAGNGLPPGVIVFGNQSPRSDFLNRFSTRTEKATEVQTSILQALSLMNGSLVGSATTVDRSETLAAVADAPFLDLRAKIETLYLATLSRQPKVKELERMVKYVEQHTTDGSAEDREKSARLALADVFWALLNSGEFFLNH